MTKTEELKKALLDEVNKIMGVENAEWEVCLSTEDPDITEIEK